MTREEVRQSVLDIIASIIPDEDLSDIDGEAPLREEAGLDSMDFLDIVMELRKRYNIDVPEDDYKEFISLNSSVNYLAPKMETM
jgi:acyl carrier protein